MKKFFSTKKENFEKEENIEQSIKDNITTSTLEKENEDLKKQNKSQLEALITFEKKNKRLLERINELEKEKNFYTKILDKKKEYFAYFIDNKCPGINGIELNNKKKVHIKNDNVVIQEYINGKNEIKLFGKTNEDNVKVIHLLSIEDFKILCEEYQKIKDKKEDANKLLPDYFIPLMEQVILTVDEIK